MQSGTTYMKLKLAWVITIALAMVKPTTSYAVRPDECEQQRAQYPKVWTDVSKEKALYDCLSHYSGALRIKIGETDESQRTMMSIVPLWYERWYEGRGAFSEAPEQGVYRIWLDEEQLTRLKAGKYFATVVRKEVSCWIRGDLNGDAIFFLDNASTTADRPGIGAFYNKSPRISAFKGDSYSCKMAESSAAYFDLPQERSKEGALLRCGGWDCSLTASELKGVDTDKAWALGRTTRKDAEADCSARKGREFMLCVTEQMARPPIVVNANCEEGIAWTYGGDEFRLTDEAKAGQLAHAQDARFWQSQMTHRARTTVIRWFRVLCPRASEKWHVREEP